MSLLQLIIIAVIQGVTEWLPISSSGHVLLAADYFGLKGRDEFLINAMAHIGTLFAVLLYFWRDVLRAIGGGVELVVAPFRQAKLSGSAHLALMILASMPIAFLAAIVHETLLPSQIQAAIRSVYTVAATTIVFGLLLW
ncbi:MAG: undecaprenyl-diphosphate phosphatase, partial [Pseudomonadota bacterium]